MRTRRSSRQTSRSNAVGSSEPRPGSGFAFLALWNDFMMPPLIISDPSLRTLPVLQNIFQTQFSNNDNVSFASYLMATAPAILVFVSTQRWVMEDVTQGVVKG